jgi:catechol 2,3-dioxygenase-like lactoylglutathione lyase family enzyme
MIDHIYLPVSDLKRSSEFYKKMLGPLGVDMPYEVGQPPIRGFAIKHSGFLAEEWRSRQRPLRRIHRQERGRCPGQLQGGVRRGSYFKQGTEPSARMACRLLRGKHRRPGRIQHRDCL